jgi:peptide/nickel transport system substrate-binding protein
MTPTPRTTHDSAAALVRDYAGGAMSRRALVRRLTALGITAPLAGAIAANPRIVVAQATPAGEAPTGELIVSLPRSLESLDPHGAVAVEESTAVVLSMVLDTLIARDPETGGLIPSLATSWEATSDTSWQFNLREGVTYHDGSAFTSADVKASLERVLELEGPLAPLWALVDTVEAPDPLTVVINTTEPQGTVPVNATLLFIGPAAGIAEEGFWNEPIGMGPFTFISWVPDSELIAEANLDYWGGSPSVQRVVIRDIPETAARMTALETGEIDFTYAIAPDQLPALQENPDLTIDSTPSYAYYFNWFNGQREPFTDARVRQAMWYALDVEAMATELMQGVGQVAQAPIPSTVFGFAPQTPYEYDPERAMALLEEAGFPDGFETTLQWNPDSGPQDRELVQTMIAYWDAIGVRVENLEKERGLWLEDLVALNWDMNFQTNTVRTGDADFTLRRLYTTEANRNGYSNPELDEILVASAATSDQEEREQLLGQACQIIWDEAVGIFPFDLIENYVYQAGIEGFIPTPSAIPEFETVRVPAEE